MSPIDPDLLARLAIVVGLLILLYVAGGAGRQADAPLHIAPPGGWRRGQ